MSKFLIDEAREWYRMWSVRLALIAGVAGAYFRENPEQWHALMALLPSGPWHTVGSILFGLALAGPAIASRLVKQPVKGE